MLISWRTCSNKKVYKCDNFNKIRTHLSFVSFTWQANICESLTIVGGMHETDLWHNMWHWTCVDSEFIINIWTQILMVGWLVILGLTALWENISVYIGPQIVTIWRHIHHYKALFKWLIAVNDVGILPPVEGVTR